ncbi:acetyltransferase [Luminiphilus sp.]|nr:acetyltransferase [Luminiphilus sp.]
MVKIAIIGASGHARVIADIIFSSPECTVVGFVDNAQLPGGNIIGIPILGSDEDMRGLQARYGFEACVIGIGDNAKRQAVHAKLHAAGVTQFESVVHSGAYVSPSASIGVGTVVCAGACIGAGASVGSHSIINTKASVDHDSHIGSFASVAPGCTIGGGSTVGDFSALGIGAVVKHGVLIGRNTVVGAGSVVLKSVSDNVVVYGAPARKIRDREFGDQYL